MSERAREESGIQTEQQKRFEREQRILDSASELLIRFGYKKTTIDDIARQARVAKGTIYLHWKTREALFMVLILRETLLASKEVLELLTQDPEGVFLHTLTRHALYIALKRPLVKALLVGDTEMLGELAHLVLREAPSYYEQRLVASRQIMELLREKGLMRTDQSIDEQLQIYTAITTGFLSVNQYLPDKLHVSIERNTEMLEETIRRTFAVSESVNESGMQEVSEQIQHIFQSVLDAIQVRFQTEG